MSVVKLWIISPDTHSERRVDPHTTVGDFKVAILVILV